MEHQTTQSLDKNNHISSFQIIFSNPIILKISKKILIVTVFAKILSGRRYFLFFVGKLFAKFAKWNIKTKTSHKIMDFEFKKYEFEHQN